MTRRYAYKRLALVAGAVLVIALLATGDFVLAGVMCGAVLATGALAIELGHRRRRPPDGLGDESDDA
jgi:hypothetical protein